MKLRAARVAAALLAPALAAPAVGALAGGDFAVAGAQGFGLNEIGSCAIARAGANTSAPCEDASSLYWNPGFVSGVPQGTSVYASGSLITIGGRFRADNSGRVYESDAPAGLPPFFGFTARTGRLVLGMAGYVPYGLTSRWNDDFPGRFTAQKAALQTFYLQPTVAYELVPGRFSIGAGAVAGYSQLELRQAIDFSQQIAVAGTSTTFGTLGFAPGTEFGRARIKGNGTGVGYNLGAHLRVSPTFTVGARYLSEVRFKYRGDEVDFSLSPRANDVVFRGNDPFLAAINQQRSIAGLPALASGATLSDVVLPRFFAGQTLGPGQLARTQIDHPAQFQAGVSYGDGRNTLSAEYATVLYRSFDRLPLTITQADGQENAALSRTIVEEYRNSEAVRVGGEHRFRGGLLNGVAGRAGFSFIRTPAPDQTVTPLLPDMNRYNFSAGVGVPVLRGRYVLDASFLRVETEGRRGRTGERAEGQSAASTVGTLNNGFYELSANVFSAGLRARF